MTKRQDKICQLLCDIGREELLKHFTVDSCIASTKVAIKVLSHFRMNARPLSVGLEIRNTVFQQLVQETGGPPPNNDVAQEWLKKGAWSVCVAPDKVDIGHVVAIVMNECLLDLSLDQASRPNKGIVMKPGVGVLPSGFWRDGVAYMINGCSVVYWPVKENEIFRTSNDWRIGSRTTPIAKEIIRQIQRKL
jgi:hypothetical protein